MRQPTIEEMRKVAEDPAGCSEAPELWENTDFLRKHFGLWPLQEGRLSHDYNEAVEEAVKGIKEWEERQLAAAKRGLR